MVEMCDGSSNETGVRKDSVQVPYIVASGADAPTPQDSKGEGNMDLNQDIEPDQPRTPVWQAEGLSTPATISSSDSHCRIVL